MSYESNKSMPDWAPENAGDEFAVRVVQGGTSTKQSETKHFSKKEYSVDELVSGVLLNNRTLLAKAITFVESNAPNHRKKVSEILAQLLPHSGKSIRIGISGVPGAGKSTLIEALGMYLINKGHKVAVLAIDPSSTLTKGSILGDKTRMEKLSREANCFIRPSPSAGALGGVTRKSRETMLVCEAAGYDVILIETVGVGQSETAVRSMVDFFLLVLIAGGGDELQGIKKGVIEIADTIAINKADGDNITRAEISKGQYQMAVHYLQQATKGWFTKVLTCSAVDSTGIENIWDTIVEFDANVKNSGYFEQRRKEQDLEWLRSMVEEGIKDLFYTAEPIKKLLPGIDSDILSGKILPSAGAELLLQTYLNQIVK